MVTRFPNEKACIEAFGQVKGVAIRQAFEQALEAGDLDWRKGHKDPRTSKLLRRFDEILGTHGVEGIPEGRNAKSPYIDYCNTGDPYTTTVMLLGGKTWRIGCWADVVEQGNYD